MKEADSDKKAYHYTVYLYQLITDSRAQLTARKGLIR